jgi:hypothetical protein
MSDDTVRGKGGASGPLAIAAIGLLVVPALYLLSDGPAMWLEMRGYLPFGLYDTLYAPLIWAARDWEGAADVLNWYESWFYPPDFRP